MTKYYRREYRQPGLCNRCGGEWTGETKQCATCRDYMRGKVLRSRKRARGLCIHPYCDRVPSIRSHRCDFCSTHDPKTRETVETKLAAGDLTVRPFAGIDREAILAKSK